MGDEVALADAVFAGDNFGGAQLLCECAHDDHAGNEAVNAVGGGFHSAMGENGDVALKEIGEPYNMGVQ